MMIEHILSSKIPIGTYFGVPTFLHWSLLLVIVILLVFAPAGIPLLLAMFSILLLHELGHCEAARYYGIQAEEITLTAVGGVALIAEEFVFSPRKEFYIALAGPAVNMSLILPLMFLEDYHPLIEQIAIGNTLMLCFNMLPIFPMDGGRVLRAFLSPRIGITKSTRVVFVLSISLAVVLCLFCLTYRLFNPVGVLVFVAMLSIAELNRTEVLIENYIKTLKESWIMVRSEVLGPNAEGFYAARICDNDTVYFSTDFVFRSFFEAEALANKYMLECYIELANYIKVLR